MQDNRNNGPAQFADMAEKGLEGFTGVQKEFLDATGRLNHDWSARATAEMALASELASNLIAARSVPEAAVAYQGWMTKRMEMLAEDSRRVIASSQKMLEASTRYLSPSSS
jgi:hypothetical protein